MRTSLQISMTGSLISFLIITSQSSCNKNNGSDNSQGNDSDSIRSFMPVGITSSNFTSICIDKNNNKWLTSHEGIYKFDGATWTHYNSSNTAIKFGTSSSIQTDAAGVVYAITYPDNRYRLAIYKNGMWSSYSLPFKVLNIYINKSTNTLFALVEGKGLLAYKGTGDYSDITSYNEILSVPGICNDCYFYNSTWYCAFRDANNFEQNRSSGFTSTNTNIAQPVYISSNPDYARMIRMITNDGNSFMLIASSIGGNVFEKLYQYENGVWSVIPYNSAERDLQGVRSLVYAKDGSLWIGSYMDGFAKYYNKQFTFYSFGSRTQAVTGIAIDDDNIKWIATESDGLLKCTMQ